ncbi:hypothetical protein CMO93_06000 [Candidatus Woesearchaeota archaeon]|nr:hypothetical protein [Candidatus Woesearchaeota archaeon]|tara:strand:- start:18020 stop:18691 length:672 start_codon:yes stop_codon:yes gene_type:complete
MKLSRYQFNEELNNPNKRKITLVFIGMSSSGKTHWANLLSKKYDFNHIEIDRLIGHSAEFINLIKDISGEDESERIGKYFGKPWDKDFKSKENKYLSIEAEAMSKEFPSGAILDFTGSSVYHPEQMEKIAQNCLVVYLETNNHAHKQLLKIYLNNPKPVCWNGIYVKKNGESNEAALARCYPLLLKYREELYEKYADVKVPFDAHKSLENPEQLIEEIKKSLA